MSIEIEQRLNRSEKERVRESKESKEQELDPEAQTAAMKERADYLVKEVKNNQNMMQNIMMNMQQVKQLIQKIRVQLQLTQDNDDPASVQQDRQQIEVLKKQIRTHQAELASMREDLIRIYSEEIRQEKPDMTSKEATIQATTFLDGMLSQSLS